MIKYKSDLIPTQAQGEPGRAGLPVAVPLASLQSKILKSQNVFCRSHNNVLFLRPLWDLCCTIYNCGNERNKIHLFHPPGIFCLAANIYYRLWCIHCNVFTSFTCFLNYFKIAYEIRLTTNFCHLNLLHTYRALQKLRFMILTTITSLSSFYTPFFSISCSSAHTWNMAKSLTILTLQ